jgi:hypothetical protein
MKALRASAAILGVLTIIVCVGLVAYQAGRNPVQSSSQIAFVPTPAPTPEPIPEWDWTVVKSETFVFQPGEGRISGEIPAIGVASNKRVSIHASSPVMAAFVDAEYRQLLISDLNQANRLPIFHCLERNTLSTTITCGLDTSTKGYVFLIKDERTSGQAFGAGLMAALGNKKPMEQATARNDVTMDYWEWKCVRNCQHQ